MWIQVNEDLLCHNLQVLRKTLGYNDNGLWLALDIKRTELEATSNQVTTEDSSQLFVFQHVSLPIQTMNKGQREMSSVRFETVQHDELRRQRRHGSNDTLTGMTEHQRSLSPELLARQSQLRMSNRETDCRDSLSSLTPDRTSRK